MRLESMGCHQIDLMDREHNEIFSTHRRIRGPSHYCY